VQHEFTTGLPPPPPTDEGFHIIRTQYAHAPRGSTYIQSTDYIPTQPQDQLTMTNRLQLGVPKNVKVEPYATGAILV
jgi:hypothetical protein